LKGDERTKYEEEFKELKSYREKIDDKCKEVDKSINSLYKKKLTFDKEIFDENGFEFPIDLKANESAYFLDKLIEKLMKDHEESKRVSEKLKGKLGSLLKGTKKSDDSVKKSSSMMGGFGMFGGKKKDDNYDIQR